MRALMWARCVYNKLQFSESKWWLNPAKCRSEAKGESDIRFRWRSPPKGCLKFNVCGVLSEDATGGGGVLRDEEGLARAIFSGPSEADDADSAEFAAVLVALETVESLGWTFGFSIIVKVGSYIVLNWLSNVEQRPKNLEKQFQDIDNRN